jgi:hypothetical protein
MRSPTWWLMKLPDGHKWLSNRENDENMIHMPAAIDAGCVITSGLLRSALLRVWHLPGRLVSLHHMPASVASAPFCCKLISLLFT